MTKSSSIIPIVTALENDFSIFRKHFYEDRGESLETPVITVSPHSGKIVSAGECTVMRVWQDTDAQSSNNGSYEIKISAHTLEYPKDVIIGILLHEMAHLYNLLNNIKDTNKNGTYHNRRFKKTAEAHGLIVEQDDEGRYGWCKTSLNDEAINLLHTIATDKFDIFRPIMPKSTQTAKAKRIGSRKYVCPDCGQIVRATKEVHIFCADCPNHPFLEWEKPIGYCFDNAPDLSNDDTDVPVDGTGDSSRQEVAEPFCPF